MKPIQYVYDADGEFTGVFLAPELWELVKSEVTKGLAGQGETTRQIPGPEDNEFDNEPLDDWERFLQFWDFRYPQENGVVCNSCGNSTQDWTKDDPRKFILKAASIGGLVAFRCRNCGCRVLKKHFKDGVHFEWQDVDGG